MTRSGGPAPRSRFGMFDERLAAVQVVAVIGFFMLTQGPVYTVRTQFDPPPTDFLDDPFVIVAFAALFAVGLYLLGRRGNDGSRVAPVVALPAAVVLLGAVASTAWSVDHLRTFGQSVLWIGTVAFGVFVGRTLSIPRQITALWAAMQLGVAISAFALWRHWPVAHDADGYIAGIYFNRNSLGPVCAIGALAGVSLMIMMVTDRPAMLPRIPVVAMVGLSVLIDMGMLIRSESLSPLLGLLVAAAVASVVLVGRAGLARGVDARAVLALVGAPIVIATVVVVVTYQRIAEALGRSSTLEGRVPLWHLVLDWAGERPGKGWGWMAGVPEASHQVALRPILSHTVNSAHSGYLEVLLGLGWVGLVLLVVALVALVARVGKRGVTGHRYALWPVVLVAYALFVNTQETFLGANLLVTSMLAVAAVERSAEMIDGTGRTIR